MLAIRRITPFKKVKLCAKLVRQKPQKAEHGIEIMIVARESWWVPSLKCAASIVTVPSLLFGGSNPTFVDAQMAAHVVEGGQRSIFAHVHVEKVGAIIVRSRITTIKTLFF